MVDNSRPGDAILSQDLSCERLSRVLGVEVTDLQPEPIANGGCHSRIFACKSEIGDLVLRMCKGDQGFYTQYFLDRVNPDAWMDQRWAIEQARSVGVPAPEIIRSDRTERWTVMRRLPGIPIDSGYESWDGCPYDELEFGVILRRMHSIEPSGYGPVDDEGRTPFPKWQEFLIRASESAFGTCVARGSLPASLAERLRERWFPELEDVDLGTPSLLHMEALGFANIMYAPKTGAITGLLDYEDCIGGDPLLEICWMKYYFEYASRDQRYFDFGRFAEGYGELELDAERLALYSPFPLLDKLRWIDPKSGRARGYVLRLEEFLR